MSRVPNIALYVGIFLIGVIAGGYFFDNAQPRSFLALTACQNCFSSNELLGLLASAGIQVAPGLTPLIVEETDKTIAIKYPAAEKRLHFVILPKKDIKDPADVTEADAPYLLDAFTVIGDLVKKNKLVDYRVEVSGPGYQTINYLHFHLVSP